MTDREDGAAMPSVTVEELERWTLFGATWRVAEITEDRAVVDLCQCTGEVEMRRVVSDPGVLEYVRRQLEADA
jgi:hypothetical protein